MSFLLSISESNRIETIKEEKKIEKEYVINF